MDEGRSLGTVFQDIVGNVQEIVRSEVRLAKAEIREEASKALSSATWLVAGAVAGGLALVFLLWTTVYALAIVMPIWAATLIVSVAAGAAAPVLLRIGLRRLELVRVEPVRTVATIKENVEWIRSGK